MSWKLQKIALIVDDSPTARSVLSKRLKKYHVHAEMVESAEAALEFLSKSHSDVIFMDHMMPGMDGFQAVRAIKSNPATATIPVMMYTSKAGELYVSQARALGAMGVLPKKFRSTHLAEILKSLHLISDEPETDTHVDDSGVDRESEAACETWDITGKMDPADWDQLHRRLDEMLSRHGQELRADIEASVERLLTESDDEDLAESAGFLAGKESSGYGWRATTFLAATLSILTTAIVWLYMDGQQEWQLLYEQNVALRDALGSQQSVIDVQYAEAQTSAVTQQQRLADQYTTAVTSLEWSINEYTSSVSPEVLFGDKGVEFMADLVTQLYAIDFSGVIHMDSYVGDFCYVYGDDGGLVLAPADLPVADCDQIGFNAEDALASSGIQSVAFANFVAAYDGGRSQEIRIQVESHGNTGVISGYPLRSRGTMAGEWNQIAKRNARVYVRLISAPRDVNRVAVNYHR